MKKKFKNLLEKTHWNHEPFKRLGSSTKCKVIWQLCWWVISVPSLKFKTKLRLTYKQQDALFKITFHPVERILITKWIAQIREILFLKVWMWPAFYSRLQKVGKNTEGFIIFFPLLPGL
jgi:hypothetical protein